jgi:hypothetical protein
MNVFIAIFLIFIAIFQCGVAFKLFIEPIIEFEYWAWDKLMTFFLILLFIVNTMTALFLLFCVLNYFIGLIPEEAAML